MPGQEKGKDTGVFWLALKLGFRMVSPLLLLLYLGINLDRRLGTGIRWTLLFLLLGLGSGLWSGAKLILKLLK